jgi:hypothetical protein
MRYRPSPASQNKTRPSIVRMQEIHRLLTFAPRHVQSVKRRSFSALLRATLLFSTLFFTELLKTRSEKWNRSCRYCCCERNLIGHRTFRKKNLTADEHGLTRIWLCPKRQFLPLMTLMTLIGEIKFVGRYKHKAVCFDQRYQCESMVNAFFKQSQRGFDQEIVQFISSASSFLCCVSKIFLRMR